MRARAPTTDPLPIAGLREGSHHRAALRNSLLKHSSRPSQLPSTHPERSATTPDTHDTHLRTLSASPKMSDDDDFMQDSGDEE